MLSYHTINLIICTLYLTTFHLKCLAREFPTSSSSNESSEENSFNTRIAGGRLAHIGDAPYMMQLRYLDKFLCGGALITSRHGNQVVVTGGQCVNDKNNKVIDTKYLTIIGGRFFRDRGHYYEQVRYAIKIKRHADFKKTKSLYYHDVAVIHLNMPFELNRLVQDIPLPPKPQTKPIGNIIVMGWGYTAPAVTEYSDYLRIGVLEMVNLKRCQNEYSTLISEGVGTRNFCAGKIGSKLWQGGCKGDGGSPAVGHFDTEYYLAGTFNWGQPKCGNRYQPSIFTDLSYYTDWIQKVSVPGVQ